MPHSSRSRSARFPAVSLVAGVLLLLAAPFAVANVTLDPGEAVPVLNSLLLDLPEMTVGDTLFLWGADEALHGDLNADGDTLDEVVQLFDANQGTSLNLGLAGAALHKIRFGGDLGMFPVSESDQGGTDLNGDGDASDKVLHLVNGSGVVTNTGLAITGTPQRVGDWVAFTVNEAEQGSQDRNGDGDAIDHILALYRISSGTVRPLDLACTAHYLLGNRAVAFLVSELQEGADLNGDGDQNDSVLSTHHMGTNTTRGFQLAVRNLGDSDDPWLSQFKGNRLGVLVHEADQNQDLDNDGDTEDSILSVVDARTGLRLRTSFAADNLIQAQNGRLIVFADEPDMGAGTDLNGDNDTTDLNVPVVIRTSNASASFLPLASAEPLDRAGRFTLLSAWEETSGGVDWNGDGDDGDKCVHVYDHATNTLRTIPLALTRYYIGAARMDGTYVVMNVDEYDQNQTDIDHDGDTNDEILHRVTIATGLIKNLHARAGWVADVHSGHASYVVEEVALGTSGVDVNQDGGIADRVVRLVDLSNGALTETRAAVVQYATMFDTIRHTSVGVWVAARELSHGCDLNGDGDPLDYVMHLARH